MIVGMATCALVIACMLGVAHTRLESFSGHVSDMAADYALAAATRADLDAVVYALDGSDPRFKPTVWSGTRTERGNASVIEMPDGRDYRINASLESVSRDAVNLGIRTSPHACTMIAATVQDDLRARTVFTILDEHGKPARELRSPEGTYSARATGSFCRPTAPQDTDGSVGLMIAVSRRVVGH